MELIPLNFCIERYFTMEKKNTRNLILTLLIACMCCLAVTLTARAETGPGAGGSVSDYSGGSDHGISKVITVGKGGAEDSASSSSENAQAGRKGDSLGMFTTTGYCNCELCSSGFNLTYSGTVPRANHTIAADISVYPIGTKLMVDDVIYTVEDMGSHVNGSWIDIYYDNHDDAVAHGTKTQEVFAVIED